MPAIEDLPVAASFHRTSPAVGARIASEESLAARSTSSPRMSRDVSFASTAPSDASSMSAQTFEREASRLLDAAASRVRAYNAALGKNASASEKARVCETLEKHVEDLRRAIGFSRTGDARGSSSVGTSTVGGSTPRGDSPRATSTSEASEERRAIAAAHAFVKNEAPNPYSVGRYYAAVREGEAAKAAFLKAAASARSGAPKP